MNNIEIRLLTTLDEMRTATELQKTYWGSDLESVIPAHMLYSLAAYGGHVLAAFDQQQMIGVLVDFLGTSAEGLAAEHLQLVSKRMVLLPEYRGQGIGYQLKCEQRRFAIRQGLELITWTFDPLLSLNAGLNIHKLGAVSRTYLENHYGTAEDGGLATLGSSDRLLAEWWITGPHVTTQLTDPHRAAGLKAYLDSRVPIANATRLSDQDGFPVPPDQINWPSGSTTLVEIPVNYPAMVSEAPELAMRWRSHTRELFQHLFAQGYVAGGFIHATYTGRERGYYVLSSDSRNEFI
jgi:predicted GNAT superfamily acetyltransferase